VANYLSITEAAAALRSGETTSVELVEEAIAVAEEHDEQLGVFISRHFGQSRAAALAADAALAAGAARPLTGIPLGVKDILSTVEGPTTGQSIVQYLDWGPDDAPAVARLRAAGGIVIGKTSTLEFAFGLPEESKPFPYPRNPWNIDTWPGGSSSGTAIGVAAGMFLGGLGTDTGGSVRIPSAFCGISGLMPTFGRVPKSGCLPVGYTLDHVGPMAGSARDCALMLGIMAGYDPSDVTAVDVPVPDYLSGLSGDLRGVRVGVDTLERFADDTDDPALPRLFAAAISALSERGAEIVDIELPLFQEMNTALTVILAGEMLAFHLPEAQRQLANFVAGSRRGIGGHTAFSGADYVQAQRVRRVVHRAITAVFDHMDLIVTPTASVDAIPFSDLGLDPTPWYSHFYTAYWDGLGNPVLSVPMGFTGAGLPLSFQIAGRAFEEALVLRAGDAYQNATGWHRERPMLDATPPAAEKQRPSRTH
jgi:aspartyl-tRNA(Asn)/glutamyl-tRNA(Gln) amidotransferase subunit A